MIKHKDFNVSSEIFPFRKLFEGISQKDTVNILYYIIKDCSPLYPHEYYFELSNYIVRYIQSNIFYENDNKKMNKLLNDSLDYIRNHMGFTNIFTQTQALVCTYNTICLTYKMVFVEAIPRIASNAVYAALNTFEDYETKFSEYLNYIISFHSTNSFNSPDSLKEMIADNQFGIAFDYIEENQLDYNLIERTDSYIKINLPNLNIRAKNNQELEKEINNSYKWIPLYLKRIHGINPWHKE